MANVKVFQNTTRKELGGSVWEQVAKEFKVHSRERDADVSIVLGGMWENPIALRGRKVLFYNPVEWRRLWPVFEFIADAYYDEMIDLSDKTVDEMVAEIKAYINEIN